MILGLNHINLAVKDLSVSFRFYKEILGFRPLCRWIEGAYFLGGDLWFCLFQDPKATPGYGYTHLAFSTTAKDFPQIIDRLKEANVKSWKDNSSEGDSFYFLDPDGYQLEIHVGDWRTRLAYKKKIPWDSVEFFED
ncbi:MAG: VOC family protein [Proteobacteria bacterium]|nr:VOC family protein [Pseudomonadota bacterium]